MAKAKKCRLVLHGSYKEISGGYFPSISKAKEFVKKFWNRPYTIIIL